MSHTYAIVEVSEGAFREIRAALVAADYGHAIHHGPDGEVIDMSGLALGIEDRSANGESHKPSSDDEKSGSD